MVSILQTLSRFNIKSIFHAVKHHKIAVSFASDKAGSISMLAKLADKGILRIRGKDGAKLLQGLITNDITTLESANRKSIFAMFLNSKGRIMFDTFIYRVPGETGDYFLECDKAATEDLIRHLKTYKLRAKVDIEDASKYVEAWVLFHADGLSNIDMICNNNILVTTDPRLDQLCIRMIAPWNQSPADYLKIGDHVIVEPAVYKEHRYKVGIAEGLHEIPSTKSLPLEYNIALLNGVSFTKGCYIGQELTARSYHTGQVRKRIMPLQLMVEEKSSSYPTFAPGTLLKSSSGKSAGILTTMSGSCGLGLVRLNEVNDSYVMSITDINGKELDVVASRPKWWPCSV